MYTKQPTPKVLRSCAPSSTDANPHPRPTGRQARSDSRMTSVLLLALRGLRLLPLPLQ